MTDRLSDAAKTGVLRAHLRESFPANAFAFLEEVNCATGFAGNGWADAIALGLWPSKGLELDGFEIKASRADLKRELAKPAKHRKVGRYCDRWTLVLWSEAYLEGLTLPDSWGVLAYDEAKERLRPVRHAQRRTPDPWPRSFVASLLRSAQKASPAAEFVARAVSQAQRDARLRNVSEVAALRRDLKRSREWAATLEEACHRANVSTWSLPNRDR